MKTWDDIWEGYKPNLLLRRVYRLQAEKAKTLAKIVNKIELPRDSKIIDIGCGSGSTLAMFRNLGYFKLTGIDISHHSMQLCSRSFGFDEGKDTFLMDARNVEFSDNSFDLVFSDGLLEHFEEPPLNIVSAFCRISKKWILLFQPNQTSLFGRVKWLWQKTGRAPWEKEYFYSKETYVNMFARFGFTLVDSGNLNLQELMWLLFAREGT
ncbi:MAG: methyltransferase domain-containing protein [Dehalococcoidia bacterium]|nr:methyltransferase domain-containing protein [Dehalococcoidia bacterium]